MLGNLLSSTNFFFKHYQCQTVWIHLRTEVLLAQKGRGGGEVRTTGETQGLKGSYLIGLHLQDIIGLLPLE